ncbi:MAG TPA: NAD(P)-binding protein [bacterium]|nr:NAD(P)-binding protein [bacterium]
MRRDYDAVLVGAGLGTLTLAALLARYGQRVLLLESAAGPRGVCSTVSVDDYIFDSFPFLLWGFEKDGVLRSLLETLGIDRDLAEEIFLPLDPAYQVLVPNHRLSLYRGRELFFHELGREFPTQLPALSKLYNEMDDLDRRWADSFGGHPFAPPQKEEKPFSVLGNSLSLSYNQLRRKTFSRTLRHLNLTGAVELFFNLQTLYFSGLPAHSTPILSAALLSGVRRSGCCTVKGGAPALVSLLEQAVRRGKGEITYESTVERLLWDRRRLLGVRATYGGVSVDITGNWVILNGQSPYYPDLLMPDAQGNHPGRSLTACSLFLGVDDRVIPEPMASHVLYLPDSGNPAQQPREFFLSLSPPWDASRSPQGKRALTVMAYLEDSPSLGGFAGRDLTAEEIEVLIRKLEDPLPFLKRFVDVATGRIFTLPSTPAGGRWNPYWRPHHHWGFGGMTTLSRRQGLVVLQDPPFASQGTAPLIRSAMLLANKLSAS